MSRGKENNLLNALYKMSKVNDNRDCDRNTLRKFIAINISKIHVD